jgi:hypothetical protein
VPLPLDQHAAETAASPRPALLKPGHVDAIVAKAKAAENRESPKKTHRSKQPLPPSPSKAPKDGSTNQELKGGIPPAGLPTIVFDRQQKRQAEPGQNRDS